MSQLEFYFDYVSPWSYVAHKRLPAVLAGLDVEVRYRPVFLGAIMDATSNRPPASVPAKFQYMMQDIGRYLRRYEIEMQFNPHFPMRTVDALRGAVVAQDKGVFDAYHDAIFDAVWRNGKDVSDTDQLVAILDEAGLEASLVEATSDLAIKERLIEQTNQAVERGVFGAPTFFVGDEMFWGQDRLEWVRDTLLS